MQIHQNNISSRMFVGFFFFLKGYGRWKNSEYLQFITILDETKKNHTPENKVWQPNIIFSLDVG